jgi:hypothetical protein
LYDRAERRLVAGERGDGMTSISVEITIDARPTPVSVAPARTALIVVDMQNDFAAAGGMMERAGIDISSIRAAVEPTARVLLDVLASR